MRSASAVPATPTIVPPTPQTRKTAQMPSSNYAVQEGDDLSDLNSPHRLERERDLDETEKEKEKEKQTEKDTRRRSIFRTQGTASSPDLQTLLRKARERASGGGETSSSNGAAGAGDSAGELPTSSTAPASTSPVASSAILAPVPSTAVPSQSGPSGIANPPTSASAPPLGQTGGGRPRSATTRAGTGGLTVSTSEANVGRLGGLKSAGLPFREHGRGERGSATDREGRVERKSSRAFGGGGGDGYLTTAEGRTRETEREGEVDREWSAREGSTKSSKTAAATMRARTAGFWGKLMGTGRRGTTSNTSSSSHPTSSSNPNTSSHPQSNPSSGAQNGQQPPPVPAIPEKYSSPARMSQAQRLREEVLAAQREQSQAQQNLSSQQGGQSLSSQEAVLGTSPGKQSSTAPSSYQAPPATASNNGSSSGGAAGGGGNGGNGTPRRPSTSSGSITLPLGLGKRRPSASSIQQAQGRPSTSSASASASTALSTSPSGTGTSTLAPAQAGRPSTSSERSVERFGLPSFAGLGRRSGERAAGGAGGGGLTASASSYPLSSNNPFSSSGPASSSSTAPVGSGVGTTPRPRPPKDNTLARSDGRRRSMSVSDLDWQTFLRETSSGLSVSPLKPATSLSTSGTASASAAAGSASAGAGGRGGEREGLTHTHTLPSLSINTSSAAGSGSGGYSGPRRPVPLASSSNSSTERDRERETESVPSTARTGSFITATEGPESLSDAPPQAAGERGSYASYASYGSNSGRGKPMLSGAEALDAAPHAAGAEEEGSRTPTSAQMSSSAGTGSTAGPPSASVSAGRMSEDAFPEVGKSRRIPMPARTTSAPSTTGSAGGLTPSTTSGSTFSTTSTTSTSSTFSTTSTTSATSTASINSAGSGSTSGTMPIRPLPNPPQQNATSKSMPLPPGGIPGGGPAFLLSPSSPVPSAYAPHHRSASASAPSLALYPTHAHSSEALRDASGGSSAADGMVSRAWELARKCWDEEQGWIGRERMAEWLGGVGQINKAALKHYMDFFDFSNLRLDQAFRRLCAKLYLKAETQQLDRILDQFARRYWQCNPTSIYGSASVVHAIAYSLLLLNTDLHIAELSSHMSRREFVKNTMETVWAQLRPEQRESTPISPASASSAPPIAGAHAARSQSGSASMDIPRPSLPSPVEDSETDVNVQRPRNRSGSLTSWKDKLQRSDTAPLLSMAGTAGKEHGHGQGHIAAASVSVPALRKSESEMSVDDAAVGALAASAKTATGQGYGKAWEADMETLLKEMYNGVKAQQILQPIANMSVSSTNLTNTPHALRRPSVRTPGNLKRGSIRGLHQLLSAQGPQSPYSSAGGSSSSIDGRLSPAPSFATSDTNFGSGSTLFTPTLGFASNLSHTIIKESLGEDSDGHRVPRGLSTAPGRRDLAYNSTASLVSQSQESTEDGELSDEELALLGPPWAKEGMLCRKQYWESTGKRAKNKDWKDVFVVIQKGELSMFIFGEGSNNRGGSGVGGGNWLSNAQQVGNVTLSHSLAHVLPPPGYNRQRPHCFVLTLSDGAVYFFQAGTEDLVNEWVSTCNYWAARLSKEPLQGGVSNMEYGWNRVLPGSSAYAVEQRSDALSIKSSSISLRIGNTPHADRTLIAEWKAPMAPSVPSPLDEETQLEALQKHVKTLQNDLDAHTQLKEPMLQLYTPRSTQYAKALANWEKKSQYLLSEVVKYTSYVECLRNAMSLRLKKQGEKAMERALNKGSTAVVELISPSNASASNLSTAPAGGSRKPSTAPVDTIQEVPEPVTPGKSEFQSSDQKKSSAEAEP